MSLLGQLRLSQFALQIDLNGFFLLLLNRCCYRTVRVRNQRPGHVDWGGMHPVPRGSGSLTGPLVLCPSPEQPLGARGRNSVISQRRLLRKGLGMIPWVLLLPGVSGNYRGGNISPPLSAAGNYREGSGNEHPLPRIWGLGIPGKGLGTGNTPEGLGAGNCRGGSGNGPIPPPVSGN